MVTPTPTDERSPFWEQDEQVEKFAAKDPDHRLRELIDAEPDPSALTVLDLGCAGGRNTVFLARRGADVHAVDASAAMVRETRRRLAEVTDEMDAARRVERGPMHDLPWAPDDWFDLVVALGILHNAGSRREWDRTLAEIARVLRPGGRLLVANFTPRTDLTGDGLEPVPGEPHVYDGLPGGRTFLLEADDLDREMARVGLEPAVLSETVETETGQGRRVTVNALYALRS